jgi:hypothetical protein
MRSAACTVPIRISRRAKAHTGRSGLVRASPVRRVVLLQAASPLSVLRFFSPSRLRHILHLSRHPRHEKAGLVHGAVSWLHEGHCLHAVRDRKSGTLLIPPFGDHCCCLSKRPTVNVRSQEFIGTACQGEKDILVQYGSAICTARRQVSRKVARVSHFPQGGIAPGMR